MKLPLVRKAAIHLLSRTQARLIAKPMSVLAPDWASKERRLMQAINWIDEGCDPELKGRFNRLLAWCVYCYFIPGKADLESLQDVIAELKLLDFEEVSLQISGVFESRPIDGTDFA